MSLRYWNTAAEREYGRQLVLFTQQIMADDKSSSSDVELDSLSVSNNLHLSCTALELDVKLGEGHILYYFISFLSYCGIVLFLIWH